MVTWLAKKISGTRDREFQSVSHEEKIEKYLEMTVVALPIIIALLGGNLILLAVLLFR